MIDLLEELHKRAVDLRHVGMMQSAGDYDYLVAWLKSPEFNNGEHLKPHPAGENTVDEYSNNCPIPFTPNSDIVKYCIDNDRAEQLIQSVRYIITKLLDVYTDDIQRAAINVYLDYSDKIITLLGGDVIEPEPEPEPPIEGFGEVIKGYFSTDGESGAGTTQVSTTVVPLYNSYGEPLMHDSGWIYDASNVSAGIGVIDPGMLGDGPGAIVYVSNRISVGQTDQIGVQITYNNRHDSSTAFIFRANEPFFMLYAAPTYKAMQVASVLDPGASCLLYSCGTTSAVVYTKTSDLKLVEVFDYYGNRQGSDGLSIESDSNGYAILVNNRNTQVDPQRLILVANES